MYRATEYVHTIRTHTLEPQTIMRKRGKDLGPGPKFSVFKSCTGTGAHSLSWWCSALRLSRGLGFVSVPFFSWQSAVREADLILTLPKDLIADPSFHMTQWYSTLCLLIEQIINEATTKKVQHTVEYIRNKESQHVNILKSWEFEGNHMCLTYIMTLHANQVIAHIYNHLHTQLALCKNTQFAQTVMVSVHAILPYCCENSSMKFRPQTCLIERTWDSNQGPMGDIYKFPKPEHCPFWASWVSNFISLFNVDAGFMCMFVVYVLYSIMLSFLKS